MRPETARLETGETETVSEIMLDQKQFEITDGYVGSFGVSYKTANEDTLREAVQKAASRNGQSVEQIKADLLVGQKIAWCDSPNHAYDHGTGYIRTKRNAKPVQLVKCSCGHSVPLARVMSSSMGTSCPDCYDRMSN